DYDEIFAPVVRQATIRILLTIAGTKNLKVQHIDVKTAFLNGELEETVYMEQPKGFEDKENSEYVCLLKKRIYGLKQAARAWNNKINETLVNNGFRRGISDPCLYHKIGNGKKIYLLLYVDGIILACEDDQEITRTREMLEQYFDVKVVGDLRYYLGIEVDKNMNGTYLL